MSETDALVERLRRANRRWKALAVVACWALALAALAWCYAIYTDLVATLIRPPGHPMVASPALDRGIRPKPRRLPQGRAGKGGRPRR